MAERERERERERLPACRPEISQTSIVSTTELVSRIGFLDGIMSD